MNRLPALFFPLATLVTPTTSTLVQDNTRLVPPLVFHPAPTHLGRGTQRQFHSSIQGPPRVRNADRYLTRHLPRRVAHARISDSATEQVLMLEARGKETQPYNPTLKMFRPQRPQETYAYLKQTIPAGSDIGRGRSSTLDVVSTLDVISTLGRI
jgi:hypothetical protein